MGAHWLANFLSSSADWIILSNEITERCFLCWSNHMQQDATNLAQNFYILHPKYALINLFKRQSKLCSKWQGEELALRSKYTLIAPYVTWFMWPTFYDPGSGARSWLVKVHKFGFVMEGFDELKVRHWLYLFKKLWNTLFRRTTTFLIKNREKILRNKRVNSVYKLDIQLQDVDLTPFFVAAAGSNVVLFSRHDSSLG